MHARVDVIFAGEIILLSLETCAQIETKLGCATWSPPSLFPTAKTEPFVRYEATKLVGMRAAPR